MREREERGEREEERERTEDEKIEKKSSHKEHKRKKKKNKTAIRQQQTATRHHHHTTAIFSLSLSLSPFVPLALYFFLCLMTKDFNCCNVNNVRRKKQGCSMLSLFPPACTTTTDKHGGG